MRYRAALALGALLAAAAVAGCGGDDRDNDEPGGKANDPFYGLISAEPLPDAPALERLGDGGAGTLRMNLAWGYVQAGPDAQFDWSHYDPVVEDAASNGIRVLATVFSSPAWAEPDPETPPLGDALQPFKRFVRAAVERYGAGGSFWSLHPQIPELPITGWQLWNEPNSGLFWKPGPSPTDYLSLLRAFRTTIESVDPKASILLGGLFPRPIDGGPLMQDYLAELYRAGGRSQFDAVTVHPYAGTPQQALQRVAELRTLMRRFGDESKPIWITEVGWASGGAPSGLTVGAERQAEYLRETFELAASERERLGIAGVVWYALSDTPGPLWPGHAGLFKVDGSAKPSWEAFAEVAGGAS